MEPSDADLLRLAGRGDERAFAALVDRHANALFQAAMSFSGRHVADAEDLVQETLVAAYRGARGFAGRASVRTWMLRILTHEAQRAWRRARHRRATRSLDAPGGAGAGAGRAGDGSASASNPAFRDPALSTPSATRGVEQRIDIMQVLQELTDPHREVLVMREIWNMTYDEIAAALDCPRGTVESRLSRARAEFRKRFERE